MTSENGRDCLGCGEWKEARYFSPQKGGKNGLNSRCKQCKADREKAYRAAMTRDQVKKDRARRLRRNDTVRANRYTPTVEYPTFP